MKSLRLPFASLLLLLGALSARAGEFLPPEEAYRYSLAVSADQLDVSWQITSGYYLYRQRLSFKSETPGVVLGAPQFPKGLDHTDDYFGRQEIYRDRVTIRIPFTVTGVRPKQLALALNWQGCADAGLCYPPTTWKASAALAATSADSGATGAALLGLARSSGGEFLPPDEAFRFAGDVSGPNTLHLGWQIAEGYYLYKSKIQVRTDSKRVQLGAPELPKGDTKTDEFFGTQEVYHRQVEADVPFSRAGPGAGEFSAQVTYQGCAELGFCYPPITKDLALALVAVAAGALQNPDVGNDSAGSGSDELVSEQDRLATIVRSGSLLALLGVFFLAGLALTFTPCVLPMIPILSGIIAGQGEQATIRRSFTLSLIYVLAMALTYTVAGVLAGLFGQNLQAALQNPWVLGGFALVFVALAFSMFGYYELQMPSAIQERLTSLSNRQAGGTYIGVGVMGVLSALIVGPCVTAPLIAALVVIGQTGDPVRGGLALFALSMGMGVPLLLVGASLGKLLPRAGGWMETVKQIFGILLLGVALWFSRTLLPDTLVMLVWGVLALSLALLLGALDAAPGGFAKARRSVALLALVWGLAIIAGAAIGNRDPLSPLAGLSAANGVERASDQGSQLVFTPIRSVAELDQALAAARAAGRPAMLDFSAEWCVSCKEMEKYTFPDEGVRSALGSVILLRADVTENNDADKALFRRFGIFGPPTIAFFGPDGVERPNFRVVGYIKADKFRQHVVRATAPSAT